MTQSRPFLVTVLSLLAGVLALIAAIHTLQYLHILPFSLGPMTVFGFDLLGALLWAATTLAYLWAARSLWQMEEAGWMFMTILSAWVVILDVIEIIGQSSIQSVLPSLAVSGAILIYCLWPGTRDKFDTARVQSTLNTAPATQTPGTPEGGAVA